MFFICAKWRKVNFGRKKEKKSCHLPFWCVIIRCSDFLEKEHIASGIELAVFYAPCDRYFTLERKIALTLDSMMLLYNISEQERKQTIEKILKLDCVKIGKEMFAKFVSQI